MFAHVCVCRLGNSAGSRISMKEEFVQIVGQVVVVVRGEVEKTCFAAVFAYQAYCFLPRLYVCLRLAWGQLMEIMRRGSKAKPPSGTAAGSFIPQTVAMSLPKAYS